MQLQAASINAGALYILATIGVGVYGVALGGWASNNRWALLGAVRATAQMISYEIAMGLAIISIVITFGTLDLQDIVRQQGGVWFGWLPRWGIFLQPIAFVMLLTAGMAESKRVPFDLPEGESELVAGYFTEYSGGKQARLHAHRLRRSGAGRGAADAVLLRRMASAVAVQRRIPLRRASTAVAARGWW